MDVFVADVFDHSADEFEVIGKFAIFHIAPDEITQHAAEILVAGERHKGTRIGEHSDEARQQAIVGKGVKLPLHSLFLVEEPPAGAELDLARDTTILIIARHRRHRVVIGGVEVVNDGFGQVTTRVESIEVARQILRLRPVADGVEASIGTEVLKTARVVVALGADVKLLGPAAFSIEFAEEQHQESGEAGALLGCGSSSEPGALEYRARFGFGGEVGECLIQSVIGKTGAKSMEISVALFEGTKQIVERLNLAVGGGAEFGEPVVESFGSIDTESLIGAKCRINAHRAI